MPADAAAPAAISMSNTQLAQFPGPPRVDIGVTNHFPPDPHCPGNSLGAIDVGLRPPQDFTWQRGPWQQSNTPNTTLVYPGVDYLAAYWLARAQGFLQDDAPSECARWSP
jgi:hypothetical protein